MICNERQYQITLKQLQNLVSAKEELSKGVAPSWIQVAQRDAVASQISDLEAQLAEYSLIKEGKVRYSESSDLSGLPKVLIQARIGKGLSQKELAAALGMPSQQIQRYEASEYMGASLARLIEVAGVLGVSVKESWAGENTEYGNSVFVWENESNIKWSEFPIKEMIKRRWIELKHKSSIPETVKEYFKTAAGPQYITALHRKKFHGENSPNEYSLLAWQARVLEKARNVVESCDIGEFNLNDNWVKSIASLTAQNDAPIAVKKLLESKGIILVFEDHLPGTYLDGAAMTLETGHPVIGLTLRHDRLDNFWFVLMHELGHVFLHLFSSLNMDFFDENDFSGDDQLEREADKFALDSLIDPELWDLCLSRFSMTKEAVVMDARNIGIHPSIIAGRIRKERSTYTILNDLIGQGSVRALFGEYR